jgi:hypothetical protein
MISAGICDDAPRTLLFRERCDLVIRSAQLERAYGLLVFKFQVELAIAEWEQFGTDGDTLQTALGFANVSESDYGSWPLY